MVQLGIEETSIGIYVDYKVNTVKYYDIDLNYIREYMIEYSNEVTLRILHLHRQMGMDLLQMYLIENQHGCSINLDWVQKLLEHKNAIYMYILGAIQ